MKKWKLIFWMMVLGTVVSWGQTTISGKVIDEDFGEELIGANVIFYQSGVYTAGISTDFDGNYQLEIDPGTYDVEVSYIGYPTNNVSGVVVEEGEANHLDIALSGEMEMIGCPVSYTYTIRLIDISEPAPSLQISREEIQQRSGKQINDIIIATPGVSLGR